MWLFFAFPHSTIMLFAARAFKGNLAALIPTLMKSKASLIYSALTLVFWFSACQKKPVDAAAYLSVDKTSLMEGPATATDSVTINASDNWTLQNVPNWLKASRSFGSAGTSGVRFDFPANSSTDSMVADIKIALNNHSNASPCNIHIVQHGAASYISANKNNLQEDPNGQTDSLVIQSNAAWSLSSAGAAWVQPDITSGGSGSTRVHLIVQANTTGQARSASLIFRLATGSSATVALVQAALYRITGFSPASIAAGATSPVTINGVFDPATRPVVSINGIAATVVSWSASAIVVTLPANATSGAFTISFGGTILTSGSTLTVAGSGHWTKVATASPFNFTNGISFVYHNKLCVGLGNDASQALNKTFQVFDPATNTCSAWPALPDSINPRAAASCFVINTAAADMIYIGLGTNAVSQSTGYRDWWQFDPAGSGLSIWKRVSDLPPGGFGGLSFVINNKAYAALAYKNQTLIRFDPLGNTAWIVVPVTLPAVQSPASFTIGNNAYWAGGLNNGTAVRSCWQFNQTNTSLKQVADVPASFISGSGFALNTLGYILTNGSGATTYQYDPSTNAWKDLAESPFPNGYFYTGVINGTAYAWNAADGSVYKFNP